MDKIDLPTDPQIATILASGHVAEATKKLEMGAIGRILGSSTEKAGNIAFFVILYFSIVFGCVLLWGIDSEGLAKKDLLLMVSSFITLALGYLFGRSTKD